jgi:hypothetical protein
MSAVGTIARCRGLLSLTCASLALVGLMGQATALTTLEERSSLVDQDVDLTDAPGLFAPNEVLHQSPGETAAFGGLDAVVTGRSAQLDAYHIDPASHPDEQIFSVNVPVSLGGTLYGPGDVVRWNGSSFASHVSAAAQGIPDGVVVDATTQGASATIISLDQTVDLGGTVVHPADLVELAGSPTVVFDGSAAGVPTGANLDAAHRLPSGNLLVSFDVPLSLGGTLVMPEDVAEWNGSTWELAIDGSAIDAAWARSNRTGLYAVTLADDDCPDDLNPEQTDSDGDTAQDACDDAPGDAFACRDRDLDTCDDCVSGTVDVAADGPDNEGDGLCDAGDPDDDNDGLSDAAELAGVTDPLDPDTDGDGACDGPLVVGACSKTDDNCPLVDNLDQANAGAPPEGDACQCGDTNGDGKVESVDLTLARKSLVGAAVPAEFDVDRCDVSGMGDPGACDVSDMFILSRYLAGLTTLTYSCNAYLGP